MTRIGSTTTQPTGGARQAGKADPGNQTTSDPKVARKIGRHDTKKSGAEAEAEKAGIFQHRMLHALQKGKMPAEFEGEGGKALLAIVHPQTPTQAVDAGQVTAAVQGADGKTAVLRVEWAENLFSRIEQAMEAGGRKQGDTITLSFELAAHETGGLRGVEISMSTTALDVVLTRTEGQATVEYLAATQALAERLHQRFSRRIVRIHEVSGPQRLAPDGMDRISDILRKPDKTP